MNTEQLIENVLKLSFLLFLIYLAVELLRKIVGGSLRFEGLVTALLAANLGYSFYLQKGLSDLTEKIGAVDSKLSEHVG